MEKNYKNILQTLGQLLFLNLFILVGYGGGLDNTALVVFFVIINGSYILLRLRGKKDNNNFDGIFKV